jgi:hypothetical protein
MNSHVTSANDHVVFLFWVMIRRRPATAHANDRSAINGRAIFSTVEQFSLSHAERQQAGFASARDNCPSSEEKSAGNEHLTTVHFLSVDAG